jgi:uncharacterized protein (TIGR02453 family)
MPSAPFGPELFQFLRELKAHNDRDWFAKNRDRYERDVRQPLLRFIADFAGPLARVSRHVVADPRPVGGSMFRIHRDTRFAKDKSPYKTHAAAWFRHRGGKHDRGPGFYLHLEPGRVFGGAGIWHPEPPTLARLRNAVAKRGAEWKKALGGPFRRTCTLEGDSLLRPPRGFPPDHPLIDDIKRKDFTAITTWSEKDALSPRFMAQLTSFCRITTPFMRFLAKALDLEF